MNRARSVTRRTLLGGAALALGAAACGMPRAAGAQPRQKAQPQKQDKVSKADAKYQDQPNGQQRCEICLQFRPPGGCELVEGRISPKGWCQFFAARENAR